MNFVHAIRPMLANASVVVLIASGATFVSEVGSTDSAAAANESWASRPKAKAGKKTGKKPGGKYKSSGNNYSSSGDIEYDYGMTWSMEDSANFLLQEGITWDNFHDEFTYAECAQGYYYTNEFNCFVESRYIDPYFVNLWHYAEYNTVEFQFVEYASES